MLFINNCYNFMNPSLVVYQNSKTNSDFVDFRKNSSK